MNNALLLSIKTKYANQIFEGTKVYEFRRKSIGEKNCHKKIYIYSSREEKSIIGYIIVDQILSDDLESMIQKTHQEKNPNIRNYFKNCDIAYALHIQEYHKFQEPVPIEEIKEKYPKFVIPQFYRYLSKEEPIFEELENRKCI